MDIVESDDIDRLQRLLGPLLANKRHRGESPDCRPVMTQAEVAEALGISRQYVYQIEKRAIEKLRARYAVDK